MDPNHASAWYNLACLLTLQEKIEKAIEQLQKACELDRTIIAQIGNDSIFDSIRSDKRFQEFMEDMRKRKTRTRKED